MAHSREENGGPEGGQYTGYEAGSTSRRAFLRSVIAAPVAARLGLGAGSVPSTPKSAVDPAAGGNAFSSAAQFPLPGFIRYDSHCFSVNDRDNFLFSAAFHYPRCPRQLWGDRLLKLKAAGFNVIETYVFWNYHEPEEGHADLSEFEDFVKLVAGMGFYMIARPGPYVCAEWDSGGFPRWVVRQRFPLRSNHPESIRSSQHWFSQVLPIIVRHQVTHSGPIILMQVENEYNYWKLPDADKASYVRALAHMAWDAGIDIPLFTCWTRQVRNRQDPDFARTFDTCNFYPRWSVVREVVPELTKLRQEQPDAPLGITELQGGWFSEFGGKLSVDQDGLNGRQLNLLTKTAFEQGVVYSNYYMGFGGTNFDWAAKSLTTSYDYAAPLREPGGLWEKYYAARGIGTALRLLGPVLTRADAAPADAAKSNNPQVSVSLRVNGKRGVVFIRENANSAQQYQASFKDPNSPTGRVITVPRQGSLELAPREMKMLPLQIGAGDSILRYSTAEILAHGESRRPYIVLYDEPGRLVEFALDADSEPLVEGDTVYQYWDEPFQSWVCGLRVEAKEQMLLYRGHLLLVLLPRERALKSWIVDWPASILPGNAALPEEEQKGRIEVPFFTDAALLSESGRTKKTAWADFDFAPGEHDVNGLVPPLPVKLWLDGIQTQFDCDKHWQTCRFHVSTPKLPVESQTLNSEQAWVERFNPEVGEWLSGPLRPLDDLGPLPYGYVKYVAEFEYRGEPRMFLSAFANDGKKAFINGRLVPEASKPLTNIDFDLGSYAVSSTNRLEIAYELFGAPNFGEKIAEMKGMESVRYGKDEKSAGAIEKWQIQRFPAAMRGRRADPNYTTRQGGVPGSPGPPIHAGTVPVFTWCRAEFSLTAPAPEWSIPWKLTIEAGRDALLYLNGRFVGRYVIAGPQKDFFLPEPYLVFGPKSRNVVSVVLAYTDSSAPLTTLSVGPYEEFATRRTRVEFQW
ncbi:MAG TPA: beta-galactosidase [Terriglobia bacterium]|nr:beta-galactosidase [Terriglobia bacterium]